MLPPVSTPIRVLLPALLCLLLAMSAAAADKPNAAARRLEQQLRAAQQDKTRLTQEKTEVENQLKETQTKVAAADRRTRTAAAHSAALSKDLDAARATIATVTAEKDALAARLAESERKLAELRLDKQRVDLALSGELRAHGDCRDRNAKMYALGNELIDRYEHKSCSDAMLQNEPFTGLKRAQIEKMIEEDRERLDKNQLLPGATQGAGR